MLAAQDGAEAAGHEAVDDLHALEVARFLQHLGLRLVDRMRTLEPRGFGRALLGREPHLISALAVRIRSEHPGHAPMIVRHGAPSRPTEQEGAGVRPMRQDARGRELVVAIGWKRAVDDRARCGQMQRELFGDRRVLDMGRCPPPASPRARGRSGRPATRPEPNKWRARMPTPARLSMRRLTARRRLPRLAEPHGKPASAYNSTISTTINSAILRHAGKKVDNLDGS